MQIIGQRKISVHEPTLALFFRGLAGVLARTCDDHLGEMNTLRDMLKQGATAEFEKAARIKLEVFNSALESVVKAVDEIMKHEGGVVAGMNEIASRLVIFATDPARPHPQNYLDAIINAVGVGYEMEGRANAHEGDMQVAVKVVSDIVGALTLPVPDGNYIASLRGASIDDLRIIQEEANRARTFFVKLVAQVPSVFANGKACKPEEMH